MKTIDMPSGCPTPGTGWDSSGLDFLSLHRFVRFTAHDKLVGTVVGSALGDCIGLYTEFLSQHEAERCYPSRKFSLVESKTEMRGDSHRDKFEPGSWTDDTDHALLIIMSYLHNSGQVIPRDFARRLQIWCRQGLLALERPPLGIGRTTSSVALDAAYIDSPESVARKHWLKLNRDSAANGSLMRTHPLGIVCVPISKTQTYQIAADMSRMTHIDPRCIVSCCVVTALVRGMLRGEILGVKDLDRELQETFDWVVATEGLIDPAGGVEEMRDEGKMPCLDRVEFEAHVHARALKDLHLDDSTKMGYVYKCLGSAIFVLRQAMQHAATDNLSSSNDDEVTFESLVTDLIMCGGDGDTNGCVAGALLGTWFGYSKLPPHWMMGIKDRDWLLKKTQSLSRMVGISEGNDYQGDKNAEDRADTALDGGRTLYSQKELDQRESDLIFRVLTKQRERMEAEEKRESGETRFGKWARSFGRGS